MKIIFNDFQWKTTSMFMLNEVDRKGKCNQKNKTMINCGTTPGNLVLTINQKIDKNRQRPSIEVYLNLTASPVSIQSSLPWFFFYKYL